MFDYVRYFIGAGLWIFTWCIALWRGRWPERTFAVATIITAFVQPMIQQVRHGQAHFDAGATALDMTTFLLLLFLSIKSGRIWPVVAVAFELISVVSHFSIFINRENSRFAYVTVAVLAGYLVLFAFQAGLVENEFRRRSERRVAAGFASAP